MDPFSFAGAKLSCVEDNPTTADGYGKARLRLLSPFERPIERLFFQPQIDSKPMGAKVSRNSDRLGLIRGGQRDHRNVADELGTRR